MEEKFRKATLILAAVEVSLWMLVGSVPNNRTQKKVSTRHRMDASLQGMNWIRFFSTLFGFLFIRSEDEFTDVAFDETMSFPYHV